MGTYRPCVVAAALQANMALHRLNQAAATGRRRSSGTDSAFALDRATRNCAISADHLPPTTAARTTKRALPPSPVKTQGMSLPVQRLLLPQHLDVPCHLVGEQTSLWFRCTTECCQSVCHNLKSQTVHDVERRQVHITHKNICGDAGPNFSAHLRSGVKPLRPNTPASEHAARWWPSESKLAAKSAGATGQGQREPEASEEQNTERLTILVVRVVGNAVTVASGPRCDLRKAFSTSVIPDKTFQKLGLQTS